MTSRVNLLIYFLGHINDDFFSSNKIQSNSGGDMPDLKGLNLSDKENDYNYAGKTFLQFF